MTTTKMQQSLIELMRISTSLLEESLQSEEAHEAATQSLKKALDVLHNTNFDFENEEDS
tara:strand:+ start:269 stop:445 length:177 start_codon:yes stop_codon:yes gene_type:complete